MGSANQDALASFLLEEQFLDRLGIRGALKTISSFEINGPVAEEEMISPVGGRHGSATRVRTVFVSDVHLGSKYSHAERFLTFLNSVEADQLYLVGDIIDGWRLQRSWRWPPIYHRIMHRLMQLSVVGTQIHYTPGNHDEFMRQYLADFGFVKVDDEFIHTTANGRRFLITHGDKFDDVECGSQWFSKIGASAYDFLMWVNHMVNLARRPFGFRELRFSCRVKQQFKHAVTFMSNFEKRLADYARENTCDGVICGHIHAPELSHREGITYGNTGDWVENCSALVEHYDGELEIFRFEDTEGVEGNGGNYQGKLIDVPDLLQHVGRRPRPRFSRPLARPVATAGQ